MAQICGIQNHNRRMTSITPLSHENENIFKTEEGVEFMLHELEPDSGECDSGTSSHSSTKKRGRPRKDAVKEIENCQNDRFNLEESEKTEEKLRKKREKAEKKAKKAQERMKNLCSYDSYESTPKKRGRPRKFQSIEPDSRFSSSSHMAEYHSSSNTDTLTPPYSDLSDIAAVGECSMMEMLNLDQELFPTYQEEQNIGLSDSFDLK